ncbi:MAG: efflux RND transporter periplasmic adaptor subunit [Thermodesulfobacteriota bacterium]|nr:efflux RND transporter periplasmic adaptor subunit [Thermodesulfobacteriota bacterium]
MRVFLRLLFTGLVMVAPLTAHAQKPGAGQGPSPLVNVSSVSLENVSKPEKFVGHAEAVVSINLQTRAEGYLEQVNFREGSFIREGQLLYIIEQMPCKARVDTAVARVNQAEADLFKTENRLRRLRSAHAASVPQTDLDDAKAAYDLAQARLQEARANLELARIDLGYTSIKAPMDGRIGKSFYKKGDLVSPSSGPLAELVSMDPIRVVFSVSEKQGGIIHKAFMDAENKKGKRLLSVQLQFSDKTLYSRKGSIAFIDNRMDPNTGTISMWAKFDNPEGELVPGEYVTVFLESVTPEMRPAVPQVAVQRDKNGPFVFVVDQNNQVKKREIEIEKTLNLKFIVKSGLRENEKVIVEGLQKVVPGITVQTGSMKKKDM